MITRDRAELTEQTIRSMRENAADWSKHRLVCVFDDTEAEANRVLAIETQAHYDRLAADVERWGPLHAGVFTGKQLGVGGAKNYGASCFPQNEPDRLLMFSDNDMWYAPGWDTRLEAAMQNTPARGLLDTTHRDIVQLGGWRHPFHQIEWPQDYIADIVDATGRSTMGQLLRTDAVTGNCFVIRWSDWLKYGPFDSNAIGPGQSEDFALSQRIKAGGGLVATLDPPVAIHCGLVNSVGEPATGWREMEEMITRQLAGLSAEMRESVLIMRPTPDPAKMRQMGFEKAKAAQGFGGLYVPEGAELPDGKVVGTAGLQPGPVISSRYVPGRLYLGTARFAEDANRVFEGIFESAKTNLDMQPRDPIVPVHKPDGIIPRREIAVKGAMGMYPARDSRKMGINVGSGQRRFKSNNDVAWINVDLVSRHPDQVPDVVADARELYRYFELDSIDYVVSHHLHEHLGHGEADPITAAAYKVLRVGGSLLVFTPDARKLAARWLGGELDDFQFAVQMMGAYQGEESDRHKWLYTQETLEQSLANAAPWQEVKPFDWRTIPGADLARDWYIAAVECVK